LFVGDQFHFHRPHFALTTYLGSWALVAPIFIARFLSNNCPFLLEVISVKSFGLFPFQAQPS
jgi:hypothetical protein